MPPRTPQYPSPLRVCVSSAPTVARFAIYFDAHRTSRRSLRAARPKKPSFYPRAKKSPTSFPRFGFSKRWICAHDARKNTPQPDPRFPLAGARIPRVFPSPYPLVRFRTSVLRPSKRVGIQNRRLSQSVCVNRATKSGLLKGACANPPPNTTPDRSTDMSPLTRTPTAASTRTRSPSCSGGDAPPAAASVRKTVTGRSTGPPSRRSPSSGRR
jgi:hypothetical protein